MKVAKLPKHEEERLEGLKLYEVLDTLPEQNIDDLTLIASQICGTPIALVSLIDETRQWFKSRVGLDASETPRDVAFCAHAILEDTIFEIPDSSKDERFKDNPLVTEAPHVRFYAGAPLKTPKGHNIGTLCVIDHTPRNLSAEQRESLEALARQVVSQLELKASYKKAEESSAAKSQFLANMSHELRTPLGGVLSFTELLLDMNLPDEAVEQIGYIKSCSENLLTIVNDILDISKIEANKIEINYSAVNLEELISSSCKMFGPISKEKRIDITSNIEKGFPKFVLGDLVRLRQILVNLIGNALKFTSEGRVNVRLMRNKKADFVIEVEDTGIGISDENKNRVFENFEQADKATTRKFGGTGLGLPICSELAGLMKGRIELESVLGKGSLFRVTLPLNEAKNNPQGDEETRSDQEGKLEKLKILAVEDNIINQKVLVRFLSKLGQDNITVASNGQECVELVKANKYDLIFMDVQMPIMDGLEATKIIKESIKADSYIVGLSANAFDEDQKTGIAAGMDAYLEKPIKISKLKGLLNKFSKAKT